MKAFIASLVFVIVLAGCSRPAQATSRKIPCWAVVEVILYAGSVEAARGIARRKGYTEEEITLAEKNCLKATVKLTTK